MNPFTPSRLGIAALMLSFAAVVNGADTNTNRPLPVQAAARGIIKVKAQFDAVVEATDSEQIKFSPKAWIDLTVIDAVAHGARVKKGDLLVKLDVEKLRDQIEELEADRPSAALGMELAHAELENLRQTT